jgi:hypothetical protein
MHFTKSQTQNISSILIWDLTCVQKSHTIKIACIAETVWKMSSNESEHMFLVSDAKKN